MRLLRMFERHPRADLSAYADGQLGWAAGERLERHIETCVLCREELAGMRALRTALADLPEVSAPRSFALTPEIAAGPARERVAGGVGPAFIAMRVAGAGVAAALAVVVLIDRDGGSDYSGNDDTAAWAPALNGGERNGDLDDNLAPESTAFQNLEATASAADSAEGEDGSLRPVPLPVDEGAAGANSGSTAGGAPDETEETSAAMPTYLASMYDRAAGDDMEAGDAVALTDALDDDDGGIGGMTVVQVVLAVVAAGALAGGFVLPLFLKRS